MAGHSKWNNIKRKKEKTDAQRAKLFTKMGREMSVAVKEGGPDPEGNSKLREIIAKAKAQNVPNENIERALKKASDTEKADYEDITYEGYGPNGIAVMVECLTDNRNRTAGDLRHYFDKYGGNLGQSGCVSYMFTLQGIIVVENNNLDEEKIMEDCIDIGAEDFELTDEALEITTSSLEFPAIRDAFLAKGYVFASAALEQVPSTYINADEDARVKMEKLLDVLEDHDDVQEIWHNWEEE